MKRASPLLLLAVAFLLTACPGPSTQATITSFTADPATIDSGGESVLRWSVTGTPRLVLQPGNLDVTGQTSLVVSPMLSTTYTLTATGSGGTDSRQTTLKVIVPPLEAVVTPDVRPSESALPDRGGAPRPMGASRDAAGVTTDFVVGELLLQPGSEAQLNAFLGRYGGTVLADDSVPEELAAQMGVSLTPAQRAPTEYLVRIDLNRIDVGRFKADAAAVGLGGLLELSSDDALRTLAGLTNALREGYAASANYVSHSMQASPRVLLSTAERPGYDAFGLDQFKSTGSQANVVGAWQFVAAHGIERRAVVAIIDGGFWVDPTGKPLTSPVDGSDLPARPFQYDFDKGRGVVGAPNPAKCTGETDCPWHGNGAAGIALGIADNGAGVAGTGGFVADPLLLHADIRDRMQVQRAIRTAVDLGADIISMSFGYSCNYWCRQGEKLFDSHGAALPAIARATEKGVMVLASAGNNKETVGDPNFYRYCVVSGTFCVGALAQNATVKADYSNFGDAVDIFAPAAVIVMADPTTTPNLATFGGTSSATPYVAGIAAMMKALNPSLTGQQMGQILRDTAHRGAGDVPRYVDALAAVRAAAQGVDGTKDAHEPNDSRERATSLTGPGPWSIEGLGLHSTTDRDYFSFESSGRRVLQVDLTYPDGLGALPVIGLSGQAACEPIKLEDTVRTNGRLLRYAVPAGTPVFGVGSSVGNGPISAYNLTASFSAAAALSPDKFEPNQTAAAAKSLSSFKPITKGGVTYGASVDPQAIADATLHTPTDVDWYVIRGVETAGLSGGGYFTAYPRLWITGNQGSVRLEVFQVLNDGTPGASVFDRTSAACSGTELEFRPESGRSYFVKVSGATGRYTLSNSFAFDFHRDRIPLVIPKFESIWEYLRPDGPRPNELVLRNPLNLGFIAGPAYRGVNVSGVRVELFQADGTLLRSGTGGLEQSLDLSGLQPGAFYGMALTPVDPGEAGAPVMLSWNEAPATRSSGNLIANPAAEDGPADDAGGPVDYIEQWSAVPGFNLPTVAYYNVTLGFDDEGDQPEPADRGRSLFVGGIDGPAAMQQVVPVPAAWRAAVDAGNVSYSLSAFLGGRDDRPEAATVNVTFTDSSSRELGRATVGPVTPYDRGAQTGLLPVETRDLVPQGTSSMMVRVDFASPFGPDVYSFSYADDLELRLMEYDR